MNAPCEPLNIWRILVNGDDADRPFAGRRPTARSKTGRALQPLGIVTGAKRDGTLMRLPSDDQSKLHSAFATLGGEAAWGVTLQSLGQTYVDPGVLLENLLPRALQLLNEIMDATPVESLSGVALKASDEQLPPSEIGEPFPDRGGDELGPVV